jgi:membrane protein
MNMQAKRFTLAHIWGRIVGSDIWKRDLAGLSTVRRSPVILLRILLLVRRGLTQHRVTLHAMALTYITVFSLVPTLAVGFAMFAAFGGLDHAQAVLLPKILDYLAVGTRNVIEGQVKEFLGNIHGGAIGGIGSLFLVLSVVSLLTGMEHAFNTIWGVHRQRSLFQRITIYWTLATVTPALLVVGITLPSSLSRVTLLQWALERTGTALLFSAILPLVLVWLGFALLYAFMPNTRVRPSAALIGGVAGGSLWSAAVYGYAVYAARAVQYSAIYGTLGVIPIFLLWIYLTWVIALLGAEVAFATQHYATYADEQRVRDFSQATRQLVALRIVCEAARNFLQGNDPVTTADLSRRLPAPHGLVTQLVDELVEAGLLRKTDGVERLVPGRDPNRTHPADVLRALRERGDTGRWPRTDPTVRQLAAQLASAEEAARAAWTPASVAELALRIGADQDTPEQVPRDRTTSL